MFFCHHFQYNLYDAVLEIQTLLTNFFFRFIRGYENTKRKDICRSYDNVDFIPIKNLHILNNIDLKI